MNATTSLGGAAAGMATPATATAADAGAGAGEADLGVAALLSRAAALRGHAVPAHRFATMSATRDGIALHSLARVQRAAEMWLAAFAEGSAEMLPFDAGMLLPHPALWVSSDGAQLQLLRSRMSAGRWASETPDGERPTLADAALAGGTVLLLQPDASDEADDITGLAPTTARQWFIHAIKKRKRIFIEGVAATFMLNIIAMMISLYTMQVYDRVVPSQGHATLIALSVGVGLAILLEFTMKQVRAMLVDRACEAIDEELSGVFFQKALSIRMDARPRTVGTFAAQIRQFETVRGFMTAATLFVLADTPFAIVFIAVIWIIGGNSLALVPLVLLPVSVLVGALVRRPLARHSEAHVVDGNRKNGLLIESIDGIESVKAVNAEWKMLDRWRGYTAVMGHRELMMGNLTRNATNIAAAIQQVSYIALIIAGVFAIWNGSITMGGLVACSLISSRALAPLAQIPSFLVRWQLARVSLQALDDMMALPSDGDSGVAQVIPERCDGRISLQDVAFSYGDGPPAVQVAGLQIQPGDRVAIIGPVGSGKSTALKLLTGLYKPSQGRAFLDGVDMTHLAPGFVREHIGYLPQDVRLFEGTLRENLALGLPAPSDAQVLAACQLTGLDRAIANHPKGLSLDIHEGGRGLSGGQRQLVGLTRMLLARPRIMLLDEPTASMDSELEARVMNQVFRNLAPQDVLVVVTHKLSMMPLVSRVVVIDRGAVQLDGPRDEVLARLAALREQGRAAKATERVLRAPAAAITTGASA
jgi:ATP-binding cassette subfamily C protein LapB